MFSNCVFSSSQVGITNDNHVVIYDNNVQYGMFSAARLWWMFRVRISYEWCCASSTISRALTAKIVAVVSHCCSTAAHHTIWTVVG